MSKEERGKVRTEPGRGAKLLFQLLQCSHFIEREMNTILQRFGLKQQQFAVLNEIVWNGPISQKELGRNLLFEKSNISRIVKILSEKGLVQITVSTFDKRLTLLIETSEGYEKWSACLRALNEVSSDFLTTLSNDEIKDTFTRLKWLEKSFTVKRENSKQQ